MPEPTVSETERLPIPSRESRLRLWWILLPALLLRLWYAGVEPNATRFWDERISLNNIDHILDHDGFRPENFWYQSLSYLPQLPVLAAAEQVYEATGWESFRVRDERGFSPNAYRFCRGSSVFWGMLSLVLTYAIGRRLFSPTAAWLGTAFLALVPWHVIASARYKPDGLLLFLTLLTFWWTLDAEERPTLGRYVLAGLGVGLTVSTKLNGVVIAVPLVVLALARMRREPAAFLRLCAAGLTSIVTYLALNPWVRETLAYLDENREIYARLAEKDGESRIEMLTRSFTSLFLPEFHGFFLGAAVFAGLGLLAVTVGGGRVYFLGRFAAERARVLAVVFLSFPVGQVVLNVLATERFKENHHAQVTPWTALLAACLLLEVRGGLARRQLIGRRSSSLVTAGIAILIVLAGARVVSAVYREVVPTNYSLAMRAISRELPTIDRGILCREGPRKWEEIDASRHVGLAAAHHESFARLDPDRLDRCDALLFDAARLEGPEGPFLLARITRVPRDRVLRFEPELFAAREEAVVLLLQDWHTVAQRQLPVQSEKGSMRLFLPGCAESERFRTLELRVPIDQVDSAWPRTLTDGTELEWRWFGKRKGGHLFVSDRIPCANEPAEIVVESAGSLPAHPQPRLQERLWESSPGVGAIRRE